MRTCAWHRMLIEVLIISILQYPFARSDSADVHNSSISDESSTSNGSIKSLGNSDPKITHEIATSDQPSPKNDKPDVCNYPGDLQDILKKISYKNGPGWVSLTFNGSKPCNLSNFNDGLRIDSVILKMTGGRRKKPKEWKLSVVEHGTWDSSKSKLTLNFTNGNNCTNDSCWEPCTNYVLKIVPVIKNQSDIVYPENIHGNLSILTTIGNISQDAKPNDLEVTDRGLDWLLLRWKAPYCSPDQGKMYTVIFISKDQKQKCSELFNQTIIITNTTGEVYHSYNMTKCDNITFKPCTEYKLRIRGEYVPAKLQKPNDVYVNLRSNDVPASTIATESLEFKQTTANTLRLSWSFALPCVNYSSQFSLSVKADSKNLPDYPVDTDCGNPSCTKDLQLLPCTKYEAELIPKNRSHLKIIKPVQTSYNTSFPDPGENYSVTTDLVGFTWVNMNLTLHPRCRRRVQSYRVTLTEEESPDYNMLLNVNKSCVRGHNPTNSVSINVTQSNCISNFTGFKSCTGRYRVEVYPELNASLVDLLNPQPIKTTFELRIGLRAPKNLNFSLHGTFVNLRWDPPESNAKCVKYYRIDIIEWESIDEQPVSTNVTTNDTHVQITKLKPATTYQFHVSARTEAQVLESTPAVLNITTPPESETTPLSIIPYVFVFIVVGITLLVFLIYWCYYKRNCFGCFEAKRSTSPSHRFHPAYYLAGTAEPEAVEETPQGRRNSRSVSRHSMRNMGHNRPIPVHDFDAALNELTENTCNLLSEQFADLKVLCNENQPKTCGAKAENKIKNRYVNILPYDHSRVHLNSDAEDEHGDYINASYVEGFNGAREYIAAQGPKPITVLDFWRMIWDQEVNIVVMVTQVEEQDKIKCAQYWPDSEQVLTYGDIKVTQVLQINMDDYVIRDLEVERDGLKRLIKQMHYLTWPDFGCPQNPEAMLSFIEAVRDRVSSLSAGGPILVHCSAGVGRTGTFIAIDWLTQEAQVISQIDIFNTVLRLRSDRMNMVQTEDQFHFIHKCISHFLKTRVRKQSSMYENANAIIPRN